MVLGWLDDAVMVRIAARISSAALTPSDPNAPNLIMTMVNIFRPRDKAGWTVCQ